MTQTIPTSPEMLTPDWLTAALRSSGVLDSGYVTACEATAIGDDQGMSGALVRVELTYDAHQTHAPATLIAKFPSPDPEQREVMFAHTLHYEREVRFYERLASNSHIHTPRCYFSAMDVDARAFVLLLEDLAPATAGDSVAGCSATQARQALAQIVALHAAWWENPALEEMDWLPQWDISDFLHFQEQVHTRRHLFLEKMGIDSFDELVDLTERLGNNLVAVMQYLRSAPRTLIHFDFHLENLLFSQTNDLAPPAVIDWQLLTLGRAAFDVAYFVCSSLTIENRSKSEQALLQHYYNALIQHGVRGYSYAQFLHDYRFALLSCLSRMIIVIGEGFLSPDQEDKLCNTIAPRYLAAIRYWNAGELIPTRDQ